MIIVKIWEGLGNQLFQYAFARSLQIRTGQKIWLDVDHGNQGRKGNYTKRYYELDNLRIMLPVCERQPYKGLSQLCNIEWGQKYLKNELIGNIVGIKYYEEDVVAFKEELQTIRGNIYLKGWFQNEQYFSEYADTLRREIFPKKRIKIPLELRQILELRETVSIHIRRGDYKRYRCMLRSSYYKRAINVMKDYIEHPYFIIFSDEAEWVKKNLKLDCPNMIICKDTGFKDYEEMFIMSRCRHNIIANSTFSWWAAWLNRNKDKIVMGPRTWFPDFSNNSGINIMPETWIKIDVPNDNI